MKTKEQKVEELVEWVAKGLRYEIKKGATSWKLLDDGPRAYWRHLATIILSHPDLALIDRDRGIGRYHGRFIASVIPLAEALKEE